MRPLIVDNPETACLVLEILLHQETGPVALDTETTGCNPKKEGPVGKARLWCMTLAWGEDDAAFVPAEWLPAFKAWLECAKYPKVGQNIYGYDRHVLANEDIRLRGIVGDTQRMSKLGNPANDGGHGLKDQARRLGFEMNDYGEVVKTVWHGKERPGNTKVGPHTPVDFEKASEEPIQVLAVCPERRAKIIEYAVRDAVATLAVYSDNRCKLEASKW